MKLLTTERKKIRGTADSRPSLPVGAHCDATFSLGDARVLVSDLFEPRPVVYWIDLLLSWAVGLAAFHTVRNVPGDRGVQAVCFLVSCLAFYRCSVFNHEIVHFRKGTLRAFRAAWNLLVGVPFLMPSFTYHTHLAHHTRKHYGTPEDGEYLALGTSPPWAILGLLAASFFYPVLAVVRFGILTPISWIHPRVRAWVQTRLSSMVIDPNYVRPLPSDREQRTWYLQEAACLGFLILATAVLVRGRLPWIVLAQAYATSVTVLLLNALRTLGAHRYFHRGEELTFTDQLLDSVNYPNSPLAAGIWAPVGLRFHALHHIFPSMPYHHMAAAHRAIDGGVAGRLAVSADGQSLAAARAS